MSLSNKILIIFFGSILLYTLMAFAEIRIKGDIRMLNEENSTVETAALSTIRYIKVSDEFKERVSVAPSAISQLKIKSKSGQLLSNLKYEIKNDTLFLHSFDETEERYHISIDIPTSGFNGFSSASSYFYLSDIKQISLSIIQEGGRVELGNSIELERLNLTSSNNSYTKVSNASIDTLSVEIDHSEMKLQSKVYLIQGTISNESDLNISDAQELQLKRDKSSTIRIY